MSGNHRIEKCHLPLLVSCALLQRAQTAFLILQFVPGAGQWSFLVVSESLCALAYSRA